MRAFLTLCCLCLLLSGCTLSPMNVEPAIKYTISDWPKRAVISTHTQSDNTLLITTPIASPGYDSSQMLYVLIPYQLRTFANHRWIAPPAELLLPLITNHIRAKNYFHAVVDTPFS